MTNYTLLKAELDVLMVYENEYEAVAQVLVKCNYPTEIERWVWVGDTLLKQGPAMAPQVAPPVAQPMVSAMAPQPMASAPSAISPAQGHMMTNPQQALQGVSAQQMQAPMVNVTPRWGGFGSPKVQMTDPLTMSTLEGTQRGLRRYARASEPGSVPRTMYESQYGDPGKGAGQRLKDVFSAAGEGAKEIGQKVGQGLSTAYDTGMGAVTAAEQGIKEAWDRPKMKDGKEVGRTGVRHMPREMYEGARAGLAGAMDRMQGIEGGASRYTAPMGSAPEEYKPPTPEEMRAKKQTGLEGFDGE